MWCVTKEQAFVNDAKIDRPTESFTLAVFGPFLTLEIANQVRDSLRLRNNYLYIVWQMEAPHED